MQALVFTAPGVVEVLDVDEPEPGPGETLVTVEASGICGSELHGISKPGFRTPPLVMGHEFSGTTDDGRRVTVNPILSCGKCDLCTNGLEQVCRERTIVGIHRAGGFAERVVVPSHVLHELPADLPWERGALVEPLANGIHAYRVSGAKAGDRVGIIGAGTIGIVCLLAAKAAGAGEVVVVDKAADRLQLARDLGADATADALDPELDAVIDAVGVAATHQASLDALRPGGTAVWIGLMSAEAGFDAQALVRKEQRVQGSFAYTDEEFAAAVELARTVPLEWAESFPLDQGATIFTELMHGRTDVVKALLRPTWAS